VHNAMLTYCEVARAKDCFAILDPPANASATGIVTYVESTAALLGASEHAAIYWPRIRVLNPSRNVFGGTPEIVVPPSGHIAGVYARVDGSEPGGVYKPPAGIENGVLLGVLGFEAHPENLWVKRRVPGAPGCCAGRARYARRLRRPWTAPWSPWLRGSYARKGDPSWPPGRVRECLSSAGLPQAA
jgi:hypothetical protein